MLPGELPVCQQARVSLLHVCQLCPLMGRRDSPGRCAPDREIGIRFHPTRGAMSLGQSKGGLPPDSCTEDETACLADMQRVIEQFHDNSRSQTPAIFCDVALGCGEKQDTASKLHVSKSTGWTCINCGP